MNRLSKTEWIRQRDAHRQQVEGLIRGYLDRRSLGTRDPVMDFLFEYYSFRPSLLARWSPGSGIILEDCAPEETGHSAALWEKVDGGIRLKTALPPHRLAPLQWLIDLLTATAARSPRLGCNGLHEWAMVYRIPPRHGAVPLRLPAAGIEAFVERSAIRCTHFDAFRFFSEAARPLNRFQPQRDTVKELEQPGCLHTNMDLYKWSYKFYPWVSSAQILGCFELACAIRTLDMQASPYDLRSAGLEPVCIETPEGAQEYARRQEQFFERSKPLRAGLLAQLTALRDAQTASVDVSISPFRILETGQASDT